MKFSLDNSVFVFTSALPTSVTFSPLYPTERNEEVAKTVAKRVKAERYCVWKLLQYAIEKVTEKKITDVTFSKLPSGKWTCLACEFSLSHRDGVIAVALSSSPVGVDIEPFSPLKKSGLERKILSPLEEKRYTVLPKSRQDAFLLETWTKKESIYKMSNGAYPTFTNFSADEFTTATKLIDIDGNQFVISVAGKNDFVHYHLSGDGIF